MIKTNAILFATLFAFCIGQNAEPNKFLKKDPAEPTVVDGPYVLYRNDSVFVKYIEDNSGRKSVKTDSTSVAMKNNITLQISNHITVKQFDVQLKKKLREEKSVSRAKIKI